MDKSIRRASDFIVVGGFAIEPNHSTGKVWITRIAGEERGEGGEFDLDAFAEAVRAFYADNF